MKKPICPNCGGTKEDRRVVTKENITGTGIVPESIHLCFNRFHFTTGNTFKCRRLKCKNTVEDKQTICNSCIERDKAKKRRIKRNARAIGIKATRKKKVIWKDKAESISANREPIQIVYAKRNKRGDILLKNSPRSRWLKVSKQKFISTEKKYSIVWNPEEVKVVSSL